MQLKTYFISELYTIEFVSFFKKLWPESGGDKLGILAQFMNHICKDHIISMDGIKDQKQILILYLLYLIIT